MALNRTSDRGPFVIHEPFGLRAPAHHPPCFGDRVTANHPTRERIPPMPADMLTDQELFDAINERAADASKAKEFAKTLRAKCPPVAQSLIDVGAGQKSGEVKKDLAELQSVVRELNEQIEAKDRELADVKSKQPDVAAIEDKASKRWTNQVKKLEQERDEATARYHKSLVQIGIDKAVAMLITPNDQGIRTDKEYAELIAAEKLRGQIVPKDDGTIGVKQIGEESEYDAPTLDGKIAALVKDFRAYIPSTFQMSNADSGAGVRTGGSGNGASGGLKRFDEIVQGKRQDSAFAGL
jgi:hypothetical protein